VTVIFAGIGILLSVRSSSHSYSVHSLVTLFFYQAIKDVSASYDALGNCLESIEHFLKRLDIYTKLPPAPALDEIIVKIMVVLLSTLALVTKQIQGGRLSESSPVHISISGSSM
jgi:hypothetical protein